MPPKKKGGSVSSGGSKKKGKGKKKSATGPIVIPTEVVLPPITSVRCATLQATIVNHDVKSLERLVAHYQYGGSLKEADSNGSTLLHMAVKKRDNPMLQRLLEYQTVPLNNQEASIIGGHTALAHACALNNIQGVHMLLQAGASPNIKSRSTIGESPLMICCKLGHVECAKLLIHYGAALDLKDNFGNNASFWAYEHQHSHMIRELELPPVHTATANEFVKLLLQRNPNFVLPSLTGKKKKKDGKGGKKKKK